MSNQPFLKSDGEMLMPGDWIEITLKDGRHAVGRFSGVWVNPHFGLVCQTVYTRVVDDPAVPVDTYFFILRKKGDPSGERGPTPAFASIDGARIVPRPSKGKRKVRVPSGATVH